MMAATVDNAATAIDLARAGLAVFPCQSGGPKAKQPMPFFKWRELSTTDERQISQWWRKWPDAAVGLDLAKCGLIVIDADRHGKKDGVEAFGRLMAEHGFDPDSAPLVATPNQGNHHVFRQPAGRELGNGRGALPDGVDVRGAGGYVVAPGTVMQDGRTYELFGDIAKAPEMPTWLLEIIEAPRGGRTDEGNHHQRLNGQGFQGGRPPIGNHPTGSSEIEELLSHIPADCGYHDWVAVLMALHAATGGAGLAMADAWSARGGDKYPGSREIEKKWRSFKRQGITLATLAMIAEQHGADLSEIAARHNRPEGYDPIEAAAAARRLLERHDGTLADAETGEIVEARPAPPDSPTFTDFPPGLVGDIARWIVSTSRKPQPALAIGSALAIVGTAAGRQFMGPTKAGTALYVLGLAPTGQGKDMPLKQSRRILNAAGLSRHLGPDEFMSFSSVVNVLKRRPLCFCPMDEFGDFMRRIYAKSASVHARAIPKVLRSMWGGNFDEVPTAEWAEKESVTIHAPHMLIFGASTHEQFYMALENGAVADGTLNRFLLIEGDRRPQTVKPECDQFDVPQRIIDDLRAIYGRSGDMATTYRNDPLIDLAANNAVAHVPWCPDGAENAYDRFSRDIETRMFAEPHNVDFLVRTAEMAVRIATIVAVGRQEDEQVRRSDMEFGIAFASQSADVMISGASDYMAENEHHANAQRVVRTVRERGGRMVYRDIARNMRNMKSRELKDLLASLCEAEILQRQEVMRDSGAGHPAIWYSLL